MTCPKCRTENATGAKFCVECGESFKGRCPKCGLPNPANAKFCQECGTSFGKAVEPKKPVSDEPTGIRTNAEPPSAGMPKGERKTVTALFADIKGSMELIEDIDPEEARAIVDPALKLMIDAAHRYDGYVVQSTGDGIFALFGAPVAHEDHPQRALYAALRIQEEMRRCADRLRSRGHPPVQARVGVNTGEVVVRTIQTGAGQPEYTPIGHSTGLAARMQTLAPIGSIAVTAQTHKLCEGYFAFKSLGATTVKGVSGPLEVYEVTGLGPLRTRLQMSAARGLSRFVGRQPEMETLGKALDEAKAGRGQIVAVVGEPGVGKSRIFYEFKLTLGTGCKVLEAFSVSHSKAVAYLPVIELLKAYFEISSDDDERRRLEKINGKVLTLERSFEDLVPALCPLLGIGRKDDSDSQLSPLEGADAQSARRRTIEAIRKLLLRESLNQQLIVIFEDLHWIDSETQALLEVLVESIVTAPILLLVNYRPEYHHQWNARSYYTQLPLQPLGRENAGVLLTALLGDHSSVSPLKNLIAQKTEGNPFFMEEMVQALLEGGALKRNGEVVLTRPLASVAIPTTVKGILSARIDRLGRAEKELLQTAAVIGRHFTPGILAAVTDKTETQLEPLLTALQSGEFVYEQPSFPEVDYLFKHALTQEVAYGSILIERRKTLHQRVAEAIEALAGERLQDRYGELAHHYERAGNAAKAVEYLLLVGQQAGDRSAYAQEMDYLCKARTLLAELPPRPDRSRKEYDITRALAYTLMALKGSGSPEIEAVFSRIQELCLEMDDKTGLARVFSGMQTIYYLRLEFAKARELGEEAVVLADQSGDHHAISSTHFALASTLEQIGDYAAALRHFEKAALPGVRSGYHALSRASSGITMWALGYPQRAVDCFQQIRSHAEDYRALTRGHVWFTACLLHAYRREPLATLESAEAMIALADQHGLPLIAAGGAIYRGWALGMLGNAEEGLAGLRRGLAAYAQTGAVARLSYLAMLAEVQAKSRHFSESLDTVDEAMAAIERTGGRQGMPQILQLKGELLLAMNSPAESDAQALFEKAIEVARGQSARSWELRASLSLARLLARQGRRGEARAMLAEIYGWFTEGFDTADLKDAKALLDELAQGKEK